jgi:hypothetical protein
MLRPINKDAPLQQGDIIRDVPFIVFPKMFNVKIPDIPGQSRINSQELDSFTKLKELRVCSISLTRPVLADDL